MFLTRALYSVLLLATASLSAHAAPATSCGVPICNLSRAIEELQKAKPQEQLNTLRKYSADAVGSVDAASLRNYLDFASQARSALVAAKSEKIVLDALNQLSSISSVRIAKYSELDAATLIDLFKALAHEKDRFEVLQWWADKIKNLEDRSSLLELAHFFAATKKISAELEDDEYVVELSKQNEQAASKKLFRLQPIFEGVYTAQVTCETQVNCAATRIDRIVIMDTFIGDNLEVNLIASKLRTHIHRFQNVTTINGGMTIEGVSRSSSSGSLAKLQLDYDLDTGSLKGYVQTADEKLLVSAMPIAGASLIRLFNRQLEQPVPLKKEIFEHAYKGTLGGKKISLRVSVFADDQVGATLGVDELPQYKLRFFAGRFFPKTGIVMMVSNPAVGGNLKMVLIAHKSENSYSPVPYFFEGITFNSENAVVNDVVRLEAEESP